MDESKPGLARDERGAVMVMGLFMAISLVGSLYFIFGIGEAIVFRDKAIEAADHAAFSAAAVHARGMNFVSALNLIMFALTIIYVVLCIVADVLIAIGILGAFSYWGNWIKKCLPIPNPTILIPGVGSVGKACCNAGHAVAKAAQSYSKLLGGIFTGIGGLEEVVKVGMPIAAEAAAVNVVSQYKPYTGIMLSASLIPGASKSEGTGIGLPLKKIEDKFLCERAFNEVEDMMTTFLPPPAGQFLSFVIDAIEGYVMGVQPKDTWRGIGCKGGTPWGDKHVHIVNDGAGNGTDHLQLWGLVVNAKHVESAPAEERVSLGKNKGKSTEKQPPRAKIYYSQAEYYFDCTQAWTKKECFDNKERNASFSMAWRARLRRVYAPSFGNQAIGMLSSFALAGGNPMNFIAGQISQNPAAQKMVDSIDKIRNNVVAAPLVGSDAGNALDSASNFLSGGDKPIH